MAEDEKEDMMKFDEKINREFQELEKKVDDMKKQLFARHSDLAKVVKKEISELEKKVDENREYEIQLKELHDKEISELKNDYVYIEAIAEANQINITELKERVEGIFESIHGISDGDSIDWKTSYREILEKTKTDEKCPKCGNYYFEHVGTGREWMCPKKDGDSKKMHSQRVHSQNDINAELVEAHRKLNINDGEKSTPSKCEFCGRDLIFYVDNWICGHGCIKPAVKPKS